MKILVSVKQVAAQDSSLRISANEKGLDESDLSFEMNEPDAYALEEGLQLRDKVGGEVVAVSLGPPKTMQTIREALAKGADRAIYVETGEGAILNPLSTAKLLAHAMNNEKPDIILTGLQSDDLGFGQTGVILAELLGYAHATIVMEIEPQGDRVRVKRELEDGWYQHVTLPLPAVLTIQSGIKKLRYATLMGIKKAKSKPVQNVAAEMAELEAGGSIERIYAPPRSKQTQVLTGTPVEVARQLVEKLRTEVRVL